MILLRKCKIFNVAEVKMLKDSVKYGERLCCFKTLYL